MKEKRKGFVLGVLVTVLVFSLSVSAFAAAQTISVNGGVKLKIDGQIFTPKDVNGKVVDVFEYNGTTYVPVRAVSQAFGKEVAWDGATRTVIIGSNASMASYNRQNPAPLNTAQKVTVENIFDKYTASVTITEAVRGEAAWGILYNANKYNEKPEDGKEYIVVKAKLVLDSVAEDKAVSFSQYDFDAFSADNAEYQDVFVVNPEPRFSGDVYQGGTLEGYFAIQVDKSDAAPKLRFGAKYDGSGGVWFNLK